jgi:SAM-dependent methyltransferase
VTMIDDERRRHWDERHSGGDFEGRGPNPVLAEAVSRLAPGAAIELACGSGTNAVWIARRGWRTTAVDWSPVGLANGKATADAAGVTVEWLERDLFAWQPEPLTYDLVAIVYLHMPPEERSPIYAAAAAAVAPGGRLVIVGHDRQHGIEGQPGPDENCLFTTDELGRELLAEDPQLTVERAEVVRRIPLPDHGPIDALLVIQRKTSLTESKR